MKPLTSNSNTSIGASWRRPTVTLSLAALSLVSIGWAQSQDTAYGTGACASLTSGLGDSCFGYYAGYNTTTGGGGVGPNNSNAFFGDYAGYSNVSGDSNAFFGAFAGFSSTANNNTLIGNQAGYSTTTGYDNVFVGTFAGQYNTTGASNTFVGYQAGGNNGESSNNIFVGFLAGINNATGTNDIYVGNQGPTTNESSTLRLGDTQTAAYMAGVYGATSSSGVEVFIDSKGQLGTKKSSLRYKEQVRDMGDRTRNLMMLRPVTFVYKPKYANGNRSLQYGLIAEEVARVYPELVAYGSDGRPETVHYESLAVMLLNEMQKQYHRLEAQAGIIEAQQQEIATLKQDFELQKVALQERMSRLEKAAQVEIAAVK